MLVTVAQSVCWVSVAVDKSPLSSLGLGQIELLIGNLVEVGIGIIVTGTWIQEPIKRHLAATDCVEAHAPWWTYDGSSFSPGVSGCLFVTHQLISEAVLVH